MVAEECAAAAYTRITDASMEPSPDSSSAELRAYLLKLDDEKFLTTK
jgi:hypothetical protein